MGTLRFAQIGLDHRSGHPVGPGLAVGRKPWISQVLLYNLHAYAGVLAGTMIKAPKFTDRAKMNRDEIVENLTRHRREINDLFGVERLALFGSAARDELTPESDIDILVSFRDGPRFASYMGLKRYLEALLGRRIDLVTEGGLTKPRVRTPIEQDLMDVA